MLDAEHARAEAALAEGEVAALAKEIALLEVQFARNLSSPCRLLKYLLDVGRFGVVDCYCFVLRQRCYVCSAGVVVSIIVILGFGL